MTAPTTEAPSRIGLLSDSHGDVARVRAAVKLLEGQNVGHFIHCGDVCSPSVFEEFIDKRFHFVWGNMDERGPELLEFLRAINITPPNGVPLMLDVDGKRIAVFHGHESAARNMDKLQGVDYVFHGHTHQRRDDRVGRMRIINPGALFRAAVKTVAVLDVKTDELTFYDVPRT